MGFGDALHPIMPDLGEGASLTLKDVVVLATFLSIKNIDLEDEWGE